MLLRKIVRRFIRIYYPVIHISHPERLPKEGATLYIANHSNSLIDPVVIGITSNRPVRFLAKAPLFKTPVLGHVMKAIGMIPAYRGQDDKSSSSVRRNVESLNIAGENLARGLPMGIFPEGKSHDLVHMEQVKTGAARIAQRAVELSDGAVPVWIVPLGLNFEDKSLFRSRLWVSVAEPVDAAVWFKEHEGNEKQAMRELTNMLDERLKSVMVHLDDARWEPLLNSLEWLAPAYKDKEKVAIVSRVQRRKNIADAINYFESKDPTRAETITARVAEHHKALEQEGIRIKSPLLRHSGMVLVFHQILKTLHVFFGFPALVGTLLHLIPFFLVRMISPKFQLPGKATISFYRLIFGLPFYGCWYVVVWFLLKHYYDYKIAMVVAVLPFLGIYSFHYWLNATEAFQSLREEIKLIFNVKRLNQLRDENREVKKEIQKLGDEYRAAFPDKFTL
ncbi:MAG: lysophospholipid acyltransferase family protein [Verrucomicrobiota bacterium]|jgi:1-acyl-sn-glycerol-3-phosphate acyltransferase|nr:lysophospholipid acyltransferase family protein [Verrucomicrobiota bacterium]